MDIQARVFNDALTLSLEWGENFHKPIQERLRHAYPNLSQAEADELDRLCREIASYAFGQIERAYIKEISEAKATTNIKARYPLLDGESLARLWSQGQYYAWRENG